MDVLDDGDHGLLSDVLRRLIDHIMFSPGAGIPAPFLFDQFVRNFEPAAALSAGLAWFLLALIPRAFMARSAGNAWTGTGSSRGLR